jgi:hypothetical protein
VEKDEVRAALEADWPELAAMLDEHDADPVTGGLDFLEMSAIVRFLAGKLRVGDTERFAVFFANVERCLQEGTRDAISLVTVGLLESLQNSNVTRMESEVWIPYLQPTTARAWQAVNEFWSGDADAIERFSRDLLRSR